MADRFPPHLAGIRTSPPLVYCPTHRRWEGFDDVAKGLCDYCCLVAPCPLGHAEGYWPSEEERARFLGEEPVEGKDEPFVSLHRVQIDAWEDWTVEGERETPVD